MIFLYLQNIYSNALIEEIRKLHTTYSPYMPSQQVLLILVVSFYLLFFGKFTKILSLSIICSITLYHSIDKLEVVDLSTCPSFLAKYLEKIIIFISSTCTTKISIYLISLVCSILIVFLLSYMRLLLGCYATYLFYNVYVEPLMSTNDSINLYISYLSILVVFILVYLIFEKVVLLVLVLLYSFTGALVLLSTSEYFTGDLFEFHKIMDYFKQARFEIPPYCFVIYFILAILGAYIQLAFVGSTKWF